MAAAGLDPAPTYASTRTGSIVTGSNREQLPAEALEGWEAALEKLRD
jgi:hypothetical protein